MFDQNEALRPAQLRRQPHLVVQLLQGHQLVSLRKVQAVDASCLLHGSSIKESAPGCALLMALVLQALFAHGADRSVTEAAGPTLLALVQGFPDAFQAAGTLHAVVLLVTWAVECAGLVTCSI